MKLIVIGDTHGRNDWKKIVEQNKDVLKSVRGKFVFMGDYFDTHEDIKANEQMFNFNEIVDFKRKNPEKVELLIGNHDFHYFRGIDEHYSGFQPRFYLEIQKMLEEARDVLNFAYLYENILFTHAGVTKTWLDEVDVRDINKLNQDLFKFTPGRYYNAYGDEPCQTPLWVRPKSLMLDGIDFIQVVGHTQQDGITNVGDCWFVDTIGAGQYLTIDIFNEDNIKFIIRNF